MSEDLKTIALERMYCLRIGDLTVALVEAEAEELFDLLHAEFGALPSSTFIQPTAEGLDRLAADLGLNASVAEPGSETPLLRHEGMTFPEPGPTLNDDIEAMIANQSPDADEKVAHPFADFTAEVDAHEEPKSNRGRPKSETPLEERVMKAWHRTAEKFPEMVPRAALNYVRGIVKATTAEVERILADNGIVIPPALSPTERAARARESRLANAGGRLEPPKVEEPKTEPTKLTPSGLVDRVPVPPLELGWQDQLALTFEVLDAGETPTTFSSYYTAKCGTEELAAYVGEVAKLRDDYWALLPFERREFKESLSAKWRKVAA